MRPRTACRLYRRPANPSIRKSYSFKARNHTLRLGRTTRIMGILNLTPDSFSGDGCLSLGVNDIDYNVDHALRLIEEGADILDLGGESTRPGAQRISAKEEISRVIPTLKKLVKKSRIPISVDTYKPLVARHALEAGASIINTIKGTPGNPELLKMVARYRAGLVLMHIQGTPRTMQKNIRYRDMMAEIIRALGNSVEKCLAFGIKSDRIIIDPGIGFGKTVEGNLEIINRLDEFAALKHPILIGVSRKSFIGKLLGSETHQRLAGSLAAASVCILKGAHIVRVHDVEETRNAVRVIDKILTSSKTK